mmetsp:Transcript_200/g.233  ORF Transcript_200/g.233 Transcript_200/m.233 type:complete len:115 (+) Transcript_200:39-383(+)
MTDFDKGLCDCFDDCEICLCSFCCPCIQFGRNMENLQSDANPTSDCCACCLIYYFSSAFGCLPRLILHTVERGLIRPGDAEERVCEDCLTICFCTPCALAQEGQQLMGKNYGSL